MFIEENPMRQVFIILILTNNIYAQTITPTKTNTPQNPDPKNIITVGFYNNSKCTGTPKAIRQIYLQDCFFWQRKTTKNSTRDNSMNNLKCFKDRLCYTQYPNSNNCKTSQQGIFKNKAFFTTCTREKQGNSWSRILSGTEFCKKTPKKFKCPK